MTCTAWPLYADVVATATCQLGQWCGPAWMQLSKSPWLPSWPREVFATFFCWFLMLWSLTCEKTMTMSMSSQWLPTMFQQGWIKLNFTCRSTSCATRVVSRGNLVPPVQVYVNQAVSDRLGQYIQKSAAFNAIFRSRFQNDITQSFDILSVQTKLRRIECL